MCIYKYLYVVITGYWYPDAAKTSGQNNKQWPQTHGAELCRSRLAPVQLHLPDSCWEISLVQSMPRYILSNHFVRKGHGRDPYHLFMLPQRSALFVSWNTKSSLDASTVIPVIFAVWTLFLRLTEDELDVLALLYGCSACQQSFQLKPFYTTIIINDRNMKHQLSLVYHCNKKLSTKLHILVFYLVSCAAKSVCYVISDFKDSSSIKKMRNLRLSVSWCKVWPRSAPRRLCCQHEWYRLSL